MALCIVASWGQYRFTVAFEITSALWFVPFGDFEGKFPIS